MSDEPGPPIRKDRLTAKGLRRGRRPHYLTQEQIENPIALPAKKAPAFHRLTVVDIVQQELSKSRRNYAADLAARTEAKPTVGAVNRVEKRLERIKVLMRNIRGIDRVD
jgi:hypothetical protein